MNTFSFCTQNVSFRCLDSAIHIFWKPVINWPQTLWPLNQASNSWSFNSSQFNSKYFTFPTAWIFRGVKHQQFLMTSGGRKKKNQAINKRVNCIMFSEWLDLPAPQYQLSPLKSTFLVGNRPVNVCKKLDVSVCEDIRLQLRSVAYGVEMNEWWQDIKVCCGWVL